MTETVFSHSVRVIACANCGAPLDVPPGGGAVRCSFCQASLQVQGRQEATESAAAASAPALDEAERFEKLRAQAAHPALLPESLGHLAMGGVLLAQHADLAATEWRQARAEVAAGAPFPVAERLFHLTKLLSDHLGEGGDEKRRRALLETAMELLQAPRHRQALRGELAWNAARLGDIEAAEQWLLGCNPRSDDLHVDTAWRVATAYVCTARQDWSGVLRVLGSRPGDIPIASGESESCGVLRAHALERSGQKMQAVEQLLALMGPGSRGIGPIYRFVSLHRELQLCPASFAEARQRVDGEIAEQGRKLALQRHSVAGIAILGGMLGVIGTIALLAGLFEKDAIMWGPTVLGIVMLALSVLIGGLGVLGTVTQRKHDALVYESGLDATLAVLEVEPVQKGTTGRMKVLVQIPGQAPYACAFDLSGSTDPLLKCTPGSTLRARVDRANPQHVLPFV